MIDLYQETIEWFRHFFGVLFSRNFAYAKFRKNKTLVKIWLDGRRTDAGFTGILLAHLS